MAILIIDDSAFVLKTHQGMIEKMGYNEPIYSSTDGGLGIEMAIKHAEELDLVLLDINMPSINGLDVLKALKENSRTQRIPVLIVTTETSRDSIQIAGHEGAMGYVIKPIKQEVLAQKLERALHFSPRLHP
jgi:CheY-like chemotaxis protein